MRQPYIYLITGYPLKDFNKWTPMDNENPPEGELVEITDADYNGWASFVYHCYLDKEFFYSKDGVKMCAAYTITHWKRIE